MEKHYYLDEFICTKIAVISVKRHNDNAIILKIYKCAYQFKIPHPKIIIKPDILTQKFEIFLPLPVGIKPKIIMKAPRTSPNKKKRNIFLPF